jgi:hypothetical protein
VYDPISTSSTDPGLPPLDGSPGPTTQPKSDSTPLLLLAALYYWQRRRKAA